MNQRNIDRLIAVRSRGCRVGDATLRYHCGDMVYDKADLRFVGRVDAIVSGMATIRWENGWRSRIAVEKLERAKDDDE